MIFLDVVGVLRLGLILCLGWTNVAVVCSRIMYKSDVIEKKKEALSQYKSMWGLPGRSKDYWLERHVLTQNKQWAFEAGITGFAEAFKSYWTRLYGSPLADEFLPCREGGNL